MADRIDSGSTGETLHDRPLGAPGAEFFRLLFDAHPAPMWVFDEETLRFLAANNAVVLRYGYSRNELLNLTVRDVIPADAADFLIDELSAGGSFYGVPFVWDHRTKAGAILSLEAIVTRFTHAGRTARLVVATDTTDRKRAETALRQSEERMRNILTHIPCGVFWKDRASIYVGCNDRVARDAGLEVAGEVIGRTDHDLATVEEEAESGRISDREVMEEGKVLLNVEETRTRPDGNKVTLLTSRVPMTDAAGRVVGVLGVYQDVTERKKLEGQLRQSQKMEAIGRLAGGIAHDFNNLLTIISGNVHLMQYLPQDDAEFPQLLDDIRDAAERAATLTRQLLAFARKQPTRPEVIDLNEVVTGLMNIFRRLLGERIVVRTQLSPTPVRVRADRSHLEQVVMNLAVNAKDAMPEGGTLTISTAEVLGNQRLAQLKVSDTGHGMTAEVKAHLFEPFFTTKDIGKGTGLGLATVYGIVDQAGGTIEVDSAPGAGATFTIRLPWCESAHKSSAIIPMISLFTRQPGTAGRSVLLVEDEDRLRKQVKFTLEGQGYTVLEAPGGEAALRLLTPDRKIDLLVTDMVMPGIDGSELAARVRSLRPHVGVVFISGYVPDHRLVEGLAGTLFLPKPFSPLDLVKTAEKALRHATKMVANATE
jgi:two-component system cell cycle sensor histidine kinase/response regulator CckA